MKAARKIKFRRGHFLGADNKNAAVNINLMGAARTASQMVNMVWRKLIKMVWNLN